MPFCHPDVLLGTSEMLGQPSRLLGVICAELASHPGAGRGRWGDNIPSLFTLKKPELKELRPRTKLALNLRKPGNSIKGVSF